LGFWSQAGINIAIRWIPTTTAGLNGTRSGNAIKLDIHWAQKVNGDRNAKMTIEKMGSNGMRLTTINTNPKNGKSIVTSLISLRSAGGGIWRSTWGTLLWVRGRHHLGRLACLT
jgi:hypothetical protein